MARLLVSSEMHFAKQVSLSDWAGANKPKKKRQTRKWDRVAVKNQIDEFIAKRDWEGATPKHFVELYILMHFTVYKVEVLEMKTAVSLGRAAIVSGKALKDHFDGNANEMATFMRWVWIQQENQQARVRAGIREFNDFRITPKYQWSAKLITDYRRYELTKKQNT